MTVEQILTEIYERSGEQSDLSPYNSNGNFDITRSGARKLLRAANTGLIRVATWKNRGGGIRFRYRSSLQTKYISYTVSEDEISGALSADVIALSGSDSSSETNGLADALLEIAGEKRIVIASSGSQVTVDSEFSSTPASGTEYTLYKRWVAIDPVGDRYIDTLKVVDLSTLSELKPATRGDAFNRNWLTPSDPSEWYREGNKLRFDVPVSSDRYFAVEVYALPRELTSADQEPDLPHQFHEAIVLSAIEWGFARMHDFQGKYSFKQDFNEMMQSLVNEWELSDARDNANTIELEMR